MAHFRQKGPPITKEDNHAQGLRISAYRFVNNSDKLAAYAEMAGSVIAAGGARFLAPGEPAQVYEHGSQQCAVLIEIDSVA